MRKLSCKWPARCQHRTQHKTRRQKRNKPRASDSRACEIPHSIPSSLRRFAVFFLDDNFITYFYYPILLLPSTTLRMLTKLGSKRFAFELEYLSHWRLPLVSFLLAFCLQSFLFRFLCFLLQSSALLQLFHRVSK